jgi:hypothetical protein
MPPGSDLVQHSLNWYWIGLQLTLPPLMALVVTIPFWRKGDAIFGNVVGSAVLFAWAIGLIFVEYVEVDRAFQACVEAGGMLCWPEPSPFARFAVYASIGLGEVFLLFTLSLAVERRLRNRGYAVEWRR